MPNQMIVINEQERHRTLYSCANCPPWAMEAEPTEKDYAIPQYYSALHAIDSGWRVVRGEKIGRPEEIRVWICPSCVKEIQEDCDAKRASFN